MVLIAKTYSRRVEVFVPAARRYNETVFGDAFRAGYDFGFT